MYSTVNDDCSGILVLSQSICTVLYIYSIRRPWKYTTGQYQTLNINKSRHHGRHTCKLWLFCHPGIKSASGFCFLASLQPLIVICTLILGGHGISSSTISYVYSRLGWVDFEWKFYFGVLSSCSSFILM
jgi:hypothetical protein